MPKASKVKQFFVNSEKTFFSNNSLKLIIFVLIIFCLVLLGFIILNNASFEKSKADYALFVNNSVSKISSLNSAIFVLQQSNFDLNKSLFDLNLKYNYLFVENVSLESSYSVLKEEVNSTLAKIDAYEEQIQSSLDWFNTNSILGENHENVLLNLKTNCKKQTSKSCLINLGCFHLVNSKFINYVYKDDLVTSSSFDKLQSISDFIKNKGGDCEDFSLFFKAEYNSLVDSCSGKKPNLFAWVENKGSRFWSNFSETWYLPDAKAKYLDVNNTYPVVVCGSIYDPQSKEINGHCVLAFASKKIISVGDISVLNNSELIEPQTGQYLGFVGSDSGVFLVSQNSSSLSYIDTLITDNDFFIFRNNGWSNYGKFGSELHINKNSLEVLIN